jgi:hypothetical protein
VGSLRDVSLGDILTALGRYRPVVLTVAAILLALAVLPKPAGLASTAAAGGAIRTPPEPTAATVAGPGADASATTVPVDASSSDASTFSPSSGATFSGSSSSSSFSGSSFGSSSDTTPTTTSSSFETTFDTLPPSSTSPTSSGPLRIVSKTWASRTSGTPLAKEGVPDGTLPVGVRGQDDKLSFVRLAGDELVLNLAEEPSGARSNVGPSSVQACPITTSGWKDGEAIGLTDIAYDTGNCVQGVRGENGLWQFDLGKYPERTGGNGFALVPGEGGGLDYQVAFRVS